MTLTPGQAAAMAAAPRAGVRADLAGDPDCPPGLMPGLAADLPTVRLALAGNPAATPTALAAVVDRVDAHPRWGYVSRQTLIAAATNPAASPALMRRLSRHHCQQVADAVAANPAIPRPLLDALVATGPTAAARAASNPHCPPDLLARLARDPSPLVRARAAANPHLGDDDLARLAGDPSSTVRDTVLPRILNAGDPLLRDTLQRQSGGTARRLIPAVPPAVARRLATDPDRRVRLFTALFTTDPDTLTVLAADPDPRVRQHVGDRILRLG